MEPKEPGTLVGGWNPTLPNPPNVATKEIQGIVTKLKPQIQKKMKMDLKECQALFYYSQVVAGANYLVLVSKFLITAYIGTIHTCTTCTSYIIN